MSEKKQKIELGWPKIKRELAIEEALKYWKKEDKRAVHILKFQGTKKPLPILSVSLFMPKYRISNRRLKAAQIHYQNQNKLPKNIFSEKNEEDNKTQFHQHQLLKEVIGVGEKNLESFFKDNDQNLPYILNQAGIIINGNRRTCALRELILKNPKKYNSKKMIDVVVLPPCSDADIDELEYDLQYQTDIHRDYEWYEIAFSYANDARFKSHVLQKNPKSRADIDQQIQSLKFGEKYLSFIKKPKRYKELNAHEEACRTWIKVRNKFKGTNRELIPYVEKRIFQAMQNPKGGRVYGFIHSLGNVENLKSSIIESANRYKIAKPKSDNGIHLTANKISEKISNLSKEESEKDIEFYKENIEEAANNAKTKTQNSEVLVFVEKSLTNLRNALSAKHSKSSTKGLSKKLDAIVEIVNKLSKWLK